VTGEHKRKGKNMQTKIVSPIYLPSDIETCHGVIKSLHADCDGMVRSMDAAKIQAQSNASQARLREIGLNEIIEYWKAKAQRQAAPVTIKSVYKD
jgi:hypothetical protein